MHALAPPAEICLVDGFRLGKQAPEHLAVVGGDGRSAAIAAASIVAKVVRDRVMRRLDALFPQYGFSSHVGYITPGHSARVREHGPSAIHRRSFAALCYESNRRGVALAPPGGGRSGAPSSTTACAAIACSGATCGPAATRSISSCGAAGGSCSARSSRRRGERHGDPLEMVGPGEGGAPAQAAATWLAAHPELDSLEMSFEVVAVRGRRLERVVVTL